jgi:hypothetical protein
MGVGAGFGAVGPPGVGPWQASMMPRINRRLASVRRPPSGELSVSSRDSLSP